MVKVLLSGETFSALKAFASPEDREALEQLPCEANGHFIYDCSPSVFESLISRAVEGETISDTLHRILLTVKGKLI